MTPKYDITAAELGAALMAAQMKFQQSNDVMTREGWEAYGAELVQCFSHWLLHPRGRNWELRNELSIAHTNADHARVK